MENLTKNERNPRKISKKDRIRLQRSLEKFGDIGGIVFNRTTGKLVGGHQRSEALKDGKITYTKRYKEPTRTGTVAEGFVEYNGEKYSFRQVEWDKKTEMEAMLSANNSAGSWDEELLKLNIADFPDLDFDLVGFDVPEFGDFRSDFAEESDEQYLRNEEKTTEPIDIERPPNDTKYETPEEEEVPDVKDVFDEVAEQEDIIGKRFVIIIDCKDADHKKMIKEKIRPLVIEAEGKFF